MPVFRSTFQSRLFIVDLINIETEGLVEVTGSHCKCGNILKTVQEGDVITTDCWWKWYGLLFTGSSETLSDLRDICLLQALSSGIFHSAIQQLTKISTDSVFHGPCAIAELLVCLTVCIVVIAGRGPAYSGLQRWDLYVGPMRQPRERRGIGRCVRCMCELCRVKEGLSRREQLVRYF